MLRKIRNHQIVRILLLRGHVAGQSRRPTGLENITTLGAVMGHMNGTLNVELAFRVSVSDLRLLPATFRGIHIEFGRPAEAR